MSDANAVGMASLNGQAPYVTLFLRVDDSTVSGASFQASGCGVVIACCSVLTQLAVCRTVEECLALQSQALIDALDGIPADKQFCADLAIAALRNALDPNTYNTMQSERDLA
jgi:NifU-like protein involved in Fe-S cluster formation